MSPACKLKYIITASRFSIFQCLPHAFDILDYRYSQKQCLELAYAAQTGLVLLDEYTVVDLSLYRIGATEIDKRNIHLGIRSAFPHPRSEQYRLRFWFMQYAPKIDYRQLHVNYKKFKTECISGS